METLSTGDVAKVCDVSPDTIRYYEKRGAIASDRSGSGVRRFAPSVVHRVRVIRNAIAVGFTLDEIVSFFAERQAGHPPCRRVRAAAGKKLEQLDRKIGEMQELRDHLVGILRDWDDRLARGEPAHLLDSLPNRKSPA